MANPWKNGIFLKLINIVVYLLFLGSNIYAASSPSSVYFHGKETYITPATWAFLIWPVIHILFLGTAIYQFFPGGRETVVRGLSWRFPSLGILSTAYVILCATKHNISAFIVALLVSAAMAEINWIVKMDHIAESWADELLIHLPLSLYLGWTTVLLFLTAFSIFGVDRLHHPAGAGTKVSVFLVLFLLQGAATTYALPASAAIAWALWAVFAHQASAGFVHWTALAVATFASICVLKGAYDHLFHARGLVAIGSAPERGPLLPEHRR